MKALKRQPTAPDADERWSEDVAILRRAAEELVQRRHSKPHLSRTPQTTPLSRTPRTSLSQIAQPTRPFDEIAHSLDDPVPEARTKAVRELYELDPDQAATLVNDALRAGSPEKRRRIGAALADSGLLYEAIDDLSGENHESCYGAFSLLFLVAKAGVVEPLITVIENNPSLDLSLAIIRLLASSGEPEVVPALQKLSTDPSLAPELRSAAADAAAQLHN